jgi:hypothetical protein
LQVRLAGGWGLSGSPIVAYQITVTLNCEVEETTVAKTSAIERFFR